MSYILDALKKSDQKRKLGAVPGLQTDHAALINIEKKRRSYPKIVAVVAGVLLLNVMLWLWWARPWQIDPPQQQASLVVVAPVAPAQPVVPQTSQSAMPPSLPSSDTSPGLVAQVPLPANPVAPVTTDVAAPTWEVEDDQEVADPVLSYPEEFSEPTDGLDEQEGAAVDEVAEAPEVVATPEVALTPNVMAQADLPGNIQQALPQIQISLHFFSNKPEARLVRINDRFLHEGDMVANELRLEEIIESGVVLRFRGYQFRVDRM